MITSSKISRILRTALVIAAWAQGSVTVGVAAHLSKPSERVSSRHGRCREPRDGAHRSAEEEGGDMLLVPARPRKRANAASTSPSGELWDEGGGIRSAITASAASNQMLAHYRVAGLDEAWPMRIHLRCSRPARSPPECRL